MYGPVLALTTHFASVLTPHYDRYLPPAFATIPSLSLHIANHCIYVLYPSLWIALNKQRLRKHWGQPLHECTSLPAWQLEATQASISADSLLLLSRLHLCILYTSQASSSVQVTIKTSRGRWSWRRRRFCCMLLTLLFRIKINCWHLYYRYFYWKWLQRHKRKARTCKPIDSNLWA